MGARPSLKGLKGSLGALHDKEVLIRLDVFLLLYFGWMAFTFMYSFVEKYSRDVTGALLRLPFTSRPFVLSLISFVHSVPPLYYLMKGTYYIGFTGSIALTVFFVLMYWRDLPLSDELAARYLLAYVTCGGAYMLFHVYAPHHVYHISVFSPGSTYLTQEEFVLPSLHNTIAALNILTLWKYRKNIWGAALIALNTLVPFSTLFLGHHWLYDALAGIVLAALIGNVTEGHRIKVHESLKGINVKGIQLATAIGFLVSVYVLLIALTMPKP